MRFANAIVSSMSASRSAFQLVMVIPPGHQAYRDGVGAATLLLSWGVDTVHNWRCVARPLMRSNDVEERRKEIGSRFGPIVMGASSPSAFSAFQCRRRDNDLLTRISYIEMTKAHSAAPITTITRIVPSILATPRNQLSNDN